VSAGAIALGTSLGGWRLIRTLGGRIYTIRPVHGFTTHIAATAVILSAALLGGPVSTTQVIGSAIMGVGASERISKVRWDVGREMVQAWALTIPATMLAPPMIIRVAPGARLLNRRAAARSSARFAGVPTARVAGLACSEAIAAQHLALPDVVQQRQPLLLGARRVPFERGIVRDKRLSSHSRSLALHPFFMR
jgi:hypothetical protein